MSRLPALLVAGFALSAGVLPANAQTKAQSATPHNLILFVPDGLRALKVTPDSAPAMAAIRDRGVNLKNSHSMFPTFTMANPSAISAGPFPGHPGTFSNPVLPRLPAAPAGDTVVPFIENDA